MRLCNCIFTLSRQSQADSPEASADRWAVLHILKVTKLNLTSFYSIFLFLSEIATTPLLSSTSSNITALRGSVMFTSQLFNCSIWNLVDNVCVCSVDPSFVPYWGTLEEAGAKWSLLYVSCIRCGYEAAETLCIQPGGQHYNNAGSAFSEIVIYTL